MKKRIVVVCPGRGSYTKESLRYLEKARSSASEFNRAQIEAFIQEIDKFRTDWEEPTVTELDSAETFKPQLHTRGEHASPLIYSCSFADFQLIDRNRYEIVAVCGNSMGWYLTLAFSGALSSAQAFYLIQTMGSMMKEQIIGGQVIYSVVDENWLKSESKRRVAERVIDEINSTGEGHAEVSIELGGYLVIGGNSQGIQALLKKLPRDGDYPFQLINHAAFHTSLLQDTSRQALERIPLENFGVPTIPMVDGRGVIWQPYSSNPARLREYTLGHQVHRPYDFTRSVSVALKEFCPDHLVLLGPGASLGGALGQILVENKWQDISSKADFQNRQKKDPFLLAMGLDDQRQLLLES